MNSRLNEIQAAVLRVLLRYLPADNAQRRTYARRYGESLAQLVERGRIRLPKSDPGAVYHQYAIEVADRDRVRDELLARGIETAIHYSLGLQRHLGFYGATVQPDCPVTDQLANTLLSLPIQPEIMEHQPSITKALFAALMGSAGGEPL
jgi:dTDP-4-amino-4,6-dideoxygalactose transaminase